eukprot:m.9675 g.9675  ORF g.9675 m.9675 type:complete len:631 (+) comp4112_c0_seq2:149-2041(+)
MKVVITGGCGFLGQLLAVKLLESESVRGKKITEMILVDREAAALMNPLQRDSRVTVLAMDIRQCDWSQLVTTPGQSVFHLAAVMSGQGEQDFDLCLDVNLKSFMALLEQCRKVGQVSLLFTSTGAVFPPLPHVTDSTKPNPMTTYGMTKAMCELLVNDYSRKGYIDARGARLPTVLIRPGKPNAATTSCYSGVVREPLSGVDIVLPVNDSLAHACGSYRTLIQGMVDFHNIPEKIVAEKLGQDRVINMPSFSTTLGDLAKAMHKVVTEDKFMDVQKLGRVITDRPDARLNAIVSSMMSSMDSTRALSLGLPSNPPVEQIIREYISDFWQPPAPKVVGFIGIGFMGQGMVTNLSKHGFNVVLYNRTRSKATTLAQTLNNVSVGESAKDVADKVEVLCLCLASENQGYDVLKEVLQVPRPGLVILDHSTVSPEFTNKASKMASARGAVYMDAPISGGPEGAANGTLAIMCGGEEGTFKSVESLLKAMGECIERMGPLGAGTATKLINQLLVGSYAASSAEAMQLAKQFHLKSLDQLLYVLSKSWGQSRVLQRCGAAIASAENASNPALLNESGAPLRNLVKDLVFVKSAADQAGLKLPVCDTVRGQYEHAMQQNLSEADISVLYNLLNPSKL